MLGLNGTRVQSGVQIDDAARKTVRAQLSSVAKKVVVGCVAASLVLTTALTPVAPAHAGKNGNLAAGAVGLAAGLIIGGALSQQKSQQQQRPQSRPKKKKKYKAKTRKKSTSKRKKTVRKKSKKKRTYSSRKKSTPAVAPVAVNSDLSRAKNALFLLGFLKSGVDSSRKDAEYRDAVRAYQKEKRVATTGVLDYTQRELLVREAEIWTLMADLGTSSEPVRGFEGSKRIQVALKTLGHYKGSIDGKLGSGSKRAIRAYQSESGLPTTGILASEAEKSALLEKARSTARDDLAAVKTQFAQISQTQLASITGGKPTATKTAAPAVKMKPEVKAAVVATPPASQGYLPTPEPQKAALKVDEPTYDPIEPVQSDAAIKRPMDVAVIIGQRNYRGDIPDVSFGHRDAAAMKSLLVNELGFSRENIIDARDAGQAELVSIFGSESNNRGKVWRLIDPDGKSNVFVFYSGHGAPDTQSRTPYLMPVDSHPDTIQLNGYPLSQMYANLESLSVKQVAVFLDACFSGGSAAGMLTQAASPVAVTARMPDVQKSKKLTVLAAAEGDQLASWDEKSGFGMFTGYLLDGLKGKADRDGDKAITAGELHQFVHDKVRRSARREFGRVQTPVLMGEETVVIRDPET